MRIFLIITIIVVLSQLPLKSIKASSDRAYQDYLYQSDVYRQKYTEFQIAKNEYLKFKTLSSENDAINKTRSMLSQRSLLLRAYLLLLQEKIIETTELLPTESNLYSTYTKTEIAFLENHSQFVNSVQSLEDAENASDKLEEHYTVLMTSIRQITLGIKHAKLRKLGEEYSELMVKIKPLIDDSKKELPVDKQAVLDRWFTQISNKRTIFLQKLDKINSTITSLKGYSIEQLANKSTSIQYDLNSAQKELIEGLSFIRELTNEMKYKD